MFSRNRFVFDGCKALLAQTGGGNVLLYNVIVVATCEVKCGKVYSADDLDTEVTVTAEIEKSSEVHRENG